MGTPDHQDLPRFDPLTPILGGIRLSCLMPSAHQFTAPWGVEVGRFPAERIALHFRSTGLPVPDPIPPIHGELIAVLRGSCCIEVADRDYRQNLTAGDVVVLSNDDLFVLRDDWHSPYQHIRNYVDDESTMRQGLGIRVGGGGARTSVLIGPFVFEDADEEHPLLTALPPVLHASGSNIRNAPWVMSTLQVIDNELQALQPGYQTIVNHLMYTLFVEAIRAHVQSDALEEGNWFRAVFDAKLAAALHAIHMQPEQPWTVASLAKTTGMSRSVFAERFTTLMGLSPLRYLAQCRMQRAKHLLRESTLGIKNIAAKVGYRSESAFCQAFKREYGESPARLRRTDPSC